MSAMVPNLSLSLTQKIKHCNFTKNNTQEEKKMFSTLNLKTLHPLQSSSSSALSSKKLKISLIRTLIVSHMCRFIRALSKLKTTIVNTLRDNHNYSSSSKSKTSKFPQKHICSNTTQKIILGSFRLHYNWCSSNSSHVLPVPTRVYQGLKPSSTSTSTSNSSHFHNYEQQQQQQQEGDGDEEYWVESELAGYLQWLEENDDDNNGNEMNEIDMLAEIFIANSHENFRLEKQESDRRFQEMLARSL